MGYKRHSALTLIVLLISAIVASSESLVKTSVAQETFDFSISVDPSIKTMMPNEAGTYTVKVSLVEGTAEPVWLDWYVKGYSKDALFFFSGMTVLFGYPPYSAKLSITLESAPPPGTYTIVIEGYTEDRKVTHTKEVKLVVKEKEMIPTPVPVPPPGKVFNVKASLSNGQINKIEADPEFTSILISVSATDQDGELTITLPRQLIDSKSGNSDDQFIILIDGNEVKYQETKTATERTLNIQVPGKAEQIEIIGTEVGSGTVIVEERKDTGKTPKPPATGGDERKVVGKSGIVFIIYDDPLPDAVVGKHYSYSFCDPRPSSELLCGGLIHDQSVTNPVGGIQPYTFMKESLLEIHGNIPFGFLLHPNGILDGIPIKQDAGKTFKFKVCAIDNTRSFVCERTSLRVVEKAEAGQIMSSKIGEPRCPSPWTLIEGWCIMPHPEGPVLIPGSNTEGWSEYSWLEPSTRTIPPDHAWLLGLIRGGDGQHTWSLGASEPFYFNVEGEVKSEFEGPMDLTSEELVLSGMMLVANICSNSDLTISYSFEMPSGYANLWANRPVQFKHMDLLIPLAQPLPPWSGDYADEESDYSPIMNKEKERALDMKAACPGADDKPRVLDEDGSSEPSIEALPTTLTGNVDSWTVEGGKEGTICNPTAHPDRPCRDLRGSLQQGDTIKTGPGNFAEIQLDDRRSVYWVSPNSIMKVFKVSEDENIFVWFDLPYRVHAWLQGPQGKKTLFTVCDRAYLQEECGIDGAVFFFLLTGTEFTLEQHSDKTTRLTVLEGEVRAWRAADEGVIVTVGTNQQLVLESDRPLVTSSIDPASIDRWWITAAQLKQSEETVTQPTGGGGCLIATAAFGSELTPQVQFLRNFRDERILSTAAGSSFMNVFNMWYYSFSPNVADAEREIPVLQQTIKYAIYPLLGILTVAEKTYSLFNGEAGAISAGFVASSMIGFVYFSPIAYAITKVRRFSSNVFIYAAFVSLAGVVAGILISDPILLMITTSAFVLTVVGISAVLSSKLISKIIRK